MEPCRNHWKEWDANLAHNIGVESLKGVGRVVWVVLGCVHLLFFKLFDDDNSIFMHYIGSIFVNMPPGIPDDKQNKENFFNFLIKGPISGRGEVINVSLSKTGDGSLN